MTRRNCPPAISIVKDFSKFLTDLNTSPYPSKESSDFVTAEWWKVLDAVLLQLKSEQFYEFDKERSVPAKWSRLVKKVAKLGRGLMKDANATQLSIGHWLEAVDPRHRYGHNLQMYFEEWKRSGTLEPFFYWLDIGEGKDVEVPICPRSKLLAEQIDYLAPKERKRYEVGIADGKLVYKETKQFLNTEEGDKYIFVLSTTGRLYVGQKQKGKFQHSSFLAGGSATAAGRLSVKNGVLELAEPHSGHYRPTEQNFSVFVDVMTVCGVDLTSKIESRSHEESRARHKLQKSMSQESSVSV